MHVVVPMYIYITIYISFQENRTYLLSVKTFDGFIPQRTDVLASVLDKRGHSPKIRHPPPFAFPSYSNIPLLPKFKPQMPSTTVGTTEYIEVSSTSLVPETTVTTLSPPRRPDDIPEENSIDKEIKKINKSSTQDDVASNDVPLTVIPLIAIGGLVLIVAVVILFVWKKNSSPNKKTKKDDMVSHAM